MIYRHNYKRGGILMKLDLLKYLVKEYIDLDLYAYKEVQLNRRLEYFLKKNNITDVEKYCLEMKNNTVEKERFISYVTINVTKFFRDVVFFKSLEEELMKLDRHKELKIWSAACSYGCEPYTLAIILESLGFRKYTIIATDIDSDVLELASEGIFNNLDIKDVPQIFIEKYFDIDDDKYIIKKSLKRNIVFKKHNLLGDSYESDFDLIVCRNVVIYFTMEAKKDIYIKFSKSISKNGLLFVGPTEHISNYKELGFSQVQPCIYKKQTE